VVAIVRLKTASVKAEIGVRIAKCRSRLMAEYGFMKSKQDVGCFDKLVAAIHRHWRNKNAHKRPRQAHPA
jgi:hypothetical protein